MGKFILTSDYQPTGDQPEAIRQLTEGLERGDKSQVLLGVTGSGKTFTMANVIANRNRPTLILSHNKTLAHQLFAEMKEFFPQNAVEYYVSYYDYYQPEAYIPSTETYIEKDLAINDEIDRLRLSAVSSLLSGRNDVIVVSSVSCIYGMGSPVALQENVIELHVGQKLDRNALLRKLVQSLYIRNDLDLQRGNFRVKGDTVDIAMAYSEVVLRVTFWDDVIDAIEEVDAITFDRLASFDEYKLMHKAGFRFVLFGLESANQATLDRLHKGEKIEEMIESCKLAKKAGLSPHVTIMFGYPWEGEEEIARTVKTGRMLLQKGYAKTLQSTIVIPYPCTPLYRECKENDWLQTENYEEFDMRRPVMKTPVGDERLKDAVQEVYKVAFNPEFILRRLLDIRSIDDVKFLFRAAGKVFGHLLDFKK